jgi:hypothetical protein
VSTPGVAWTPPAPDSRPRLGDPSTAVVHRYRRSRSLASRWYLLPMLAMVATVTGVAAFAFARAPVPPGVDPGHWLAISYGYVGLPSAPDPTDQLLFYPPLMFPILGGLVVLTGNPLEAAGVFAIGLFLVYGLSVVHLARRFLVSGPLQVALVGLAMFSGTTIQMLFWGGYPNLLGFILINEALVALLVFLRTERSFDGAIFYTVVGLTYFAHDLSFAVLVGSIAISGFFLLTLRRVRAGFLLHPANLIGVTALALVIGGYTALTAHLGIGHADYIGANPSAYYMDHVGELFAPLAHAPLLAPAGAPVYLPPLPTAVALAVAPLVALGALYGLQRAYPGRVDRRLTIAGAWLAAALAIPGVGYLDHVDTDYTRFLYFLPLPFYLVFLAGVERAFPRELLPAPDPTVAVPGSAPASRRLRRRPLDPGRAHATGVAGFTVAVTLLVTFALVTVPLITGNEVASTATAHDAAFLEATQWLKDNRTPGTVLTVPSTARWTEALSNRDAFTVGPVWLLFNPFQIADSQEAYWALTSQYVLLNSESALSFSGFATPVMSQGPMYTAYVQGLPFPVVRILPGSLSLNATGPNGTHTYSLGGGQIPGPTPAGLNSSNLTVLYTSPVATVRETSWMTSDGGARVRFDVEPVRGVTVRSLGAEISGPPPGSPTLDRDSIVSTTFSATNVTFLVSGRLGQYPTPAEVATTVRFTPAPLWVPPTVPASAGTWNAQFRDPNGSSPFGVEFGFASVGASYPNDALPPSLSTLGFLDAHSVAFLLWPTHLAGSVEPTYYESTFGFHLAFQNSEWVILAR